MALTYSTSWEAWVEKVRFTGARLSRAEAAAVSPLSAWAGAAVAAGAGSVFAPQAARDSSMQTTRSNANAFFIFVRSFLLFYLYYRKLPVIELLRLNFP